MFVSACASHGECVIVCRSTQKKGQLLKVFKIKAIVFFDLRYRLKNDSLEVFYLNGSLLVNSEITGGEQRAVEISCMLWILMWY
jgi:hypothetical protein